MHHLVATSPHFSTTGKSHSHLSRVSIVIADMKALPNMNELRHLIYRSISHHHVSALLLIHCTTSSSCLSADCTSLSLAPQSSPLHRFLLCIHTSYSSPQYSDSCHAKCFVQVWELKCHRYVGHVADLLSLIYLTLSKTVCIQQ